MGGTNLKPVNSLPQLNTVDSSSMVQQQNDKQSDKQLTRMNSQNQLANTNGSSNTIRNLLALQSPLIPISSSNNNTNHLNVNMRVSTGGNIYNIT